VDSRSGSEIGIYYPPIWAPAERYMQVYPCNIVATSPLIHLFVLRMSGKYGPHLLQYDKEEQFIFQIRSEKYLLCAKKMQITIIHCLLLLLLL
jgi:hypothetical protein